MVEKEVSMKKVAIAAVFFMVLCSAVWANGPKQYTVAVLDFEMIGIRDGHSALVMDSFKHHLQQLIDSPQFRNGRHFSNIGYARYEIIDAGALHPGGNAAQQAVPLDDAALHSTAVQYGKRHNVDHIIVGRCSQISGQYNLSVRLIDVQSGRQLASAHRTGYDDFDYFHEHAVEKVVKDLFGEPYITVNIPDCVDRVAHNPAPRKNAYVGSRMLSDDFNAVYGSMSRPQHVFGDMYEEGTGGVIEFFSAGRYDDYGIGLHIGYGRFGLISETFDPSMIKKIEAIDNSSTGTDIPQKGETTSSSTSGSVSGYSGYNEIAEFMPVLRIHINDGTVRFFGQGGYGYYLLHQDYGYFNDAGDEVSVSKQYGGWGFAYGGGVTLFHRFVIMPMWYDFSYDRKIPGAETEKKSIELQYMVLNAGYMF
jgi:hypothetical protein